MDGFVSTEDDLLEALEALEHEIEDEDGLVEFIDNLTTVASALHAHFLKSWWSRRPPTLDKVLKSLAREQRKPALKILGNRVGLLTKSIRKHAYGGWDSDDSEDLVIEANTLREQVSQAIEDLLPPRHEAPSPDPSK